MATSLRPRSSELWLDNYVMLAGQSDLSVAA
jgi:hypothetical protein